MPEHNTAAASPETTTDQWDRRPAITLLTVIAACYAETIGVVLAQVL
jgi:hypothetical protein